MENFKNSILNKCKRHVAPKDKRRGITEKATFAIAFLIFTIYAFIMIYMILWVAMSSFKTNREFYRDPFALPAVWQFKNYISAFEELRFNGVNFIGMTFNSIWYSLGLTVIHILACSATGYVFAKYEFGAKKTMMSIAILAMVIPIIGSLPAQYKLMHDLNLVDSPLVLVTALAGFGMHFIIMKSYFQSLSWSYAEAAFIDGATHFGVFFKIMLPMAKGPALALGIRAFIGYWNDYYSPLLYLDEMPTLSTGLYLYRLELNYASNEPVYFAGVVMSMIPVFVLFTIFSEQIMNNVVAGGLKG
ncbi:MAG: carbohydrate ABC transporter permease [Clostridia bacterium]|nr:carbohydrate ABC transporter permease [Clostridia bacterium]